MGSRSQALCDALTQFSTEAKRKAEKDRTGFGRHAVNPEEPDVDKKLARLEERRDKGIEGCTYHLGIGTRVNRLHNRGRFVGVTEESRYENTDITTEFLESEIYGEVQRYASAGLEFVIPVEAAACEVWTC